MKLFPPISWIGQAACWLWRLLLVRRDLDRLENKLGQLETSTPPRPRDMILLHGLYWGVPEGATRRHAYCPGCAAQGIYVPLSRNDRVGSVDEASYCCPKCRWNVFLGSDQEREALGS